MNEIKDSVVNNGYIIKYVMNFFYLPRHDSLFTIGIDKLVCGRYNNTGFFKYI